MKSIPTERVSERQALTFPDSEHRVQKENLMVNSTEVEKELLIYSAILISKAQTMGMHSVR